MTEANKLPVHLNNSFPVVKATVASNVFWYGKFGLKSLPDEAGQFFISHICLNVILRLRHPSTWQKPLP
jgi:hypothetical protein